MKVIIAGSRSITDRKPVWKAIDASGFSITEVVSGNADGVDKLGELWAASENIPVKRFLPDWKRLGKKAGIVRNQEMGKYADALIAVWNGKSLGTAYMIGYMRKIRKPTFVWKRVCG